MTPPTPGGVAWRGLAAAASALLLLAGGTMADELAPTGEPAPTAVEAAAAAPETPPDATTSHELTLADGTLAYTARSGVLPVRPAPDRPEAEIFYVAYTRDGAAPGRPLTFLFNGGPGAASVFLHLGGIGPRRLAVHPDGTWPRHRSACSTTR
jgi:carboxypeptidase C (cathepsin A)